MHRADCCGTTKVRRDTLAPKHLLNNKLNILFDRQVWAARSHRSYRKLQGLNSKVPESIFYI